VTEICTGGELFERIIAKTESTLGHFSEHDAANLVRDILDAIAYCHDIKGIAHRDLKPENFLFATEAEDAPIKIIDFGLSRHDDVNHGIMKTKVGKLTLTTTKFLFPQRLAPNDLLYWFRNAILRSPRGSASTGKPGLSEVPV